MAAFSPLDRDPDEDACQRERLEDAADEEQRLEDLLDRAAEQASLFPPPPGGAPPRADRAPQAPRPGRREGGGMTAAPIADPVGVVDPTGRRHKLALSPAATSPCSPVPCTRRR
jgi:hypothetical protein